MEVNESLNERFELAMERIHEIPEELAVEGIYKEYFRRTAEFIGKIETIWNQNGSWERSIEELERENTWLYEDIRAEAYETSYANPQYSVEKIGKEYGPILSMLYAQMYSMTADVYERCLENITVNAELFIEIYNIMEQEDKSPQQVKDAVYWFFSDYSDLFAAQRVEQMLSTEDSFYKDIIESSGADLRYLYRYGLNITENEKKMAAYLNRLSKEKLEFVAKTFVEGYCRGFELTKRDLSKKNRFDLRYCVGLEPLVKASLPMFERLGLTPVYRRICIRSTPASRQFSYDHRYDNAVYLDRQYKERYMQVLRVAYEENKEAAAGYAGPLCLDTFGEVPFQPKFHPGAYQLSEKQQKLYVEFSNEQRMLLNQYIPDEETSFSIIAFPTPEIGENFEEIFHETMAVNTLDNETYQEIQQAMIDVLDQADFVRVKGRGKNRTDLTVALHPLTDPATQTKFENCLADVNIPLGEIFTSPQLSGTNGMLHVTRVLLNGLEYKELELIFEDGRIVQYSCANFDTEEENKAFIKENLLFHRDTLPLGEFAIGTNTTAYAMGQKYGISDRLPILIAEKTGPHFAVGDTCYSHSEDVAVYNPDGKEIIARDNEYSILRKTEPQNAYFSCHTDITIPYDELGALYCVKADKTQIPIILDSRFVLPKTEKLNAPLDGIHQK